MWVSSVTIHNVFLQAHVCISSGSNSVIGPLTFFKTATEFASTKFLKLHVICIAVNHKNISMYCGEIL